MKDSHTVEGLVVDVPAGCLVCAAEYLKQGTAHLTKADNQYQSLG